MCVLFPTQRTGTQSTSPEKAVPDEQLYCLMQVHMQGRQQLQVSQCNVAAGMLFWGSLLLASPACAYRKWVPVNGVSQGSLCAVKGLRVGLPGAQCANKLLHMHVVQIFQPR